MERVASSNQTRELAYVSSQIAFHTSQKRRNDILAIVSLVAYFAISTFGIWYAATFAATTLPLVLALLSSGLYAIHHLFFHPCKLKSYDHNEELSFFTQIKTEMEKSQNYNAAKIAVITKLNHNLLANLYKIFQEDPQFHSDGTPLNYRALRAFFKQNRTYANDTQPLQDRLHLYRSEKRKSQITLTRNWIRGHFRSTEGQWCEGRSAETTGFRIKDKSRLITAKEILKKFKQIAKDHRPDYLNPEYFTQLDNAFETSIHTLLTTPTAQ